MLIQAISLPAPATPRSSAALPECQLWRSARGPTPQTNLNSGEATTILASCGSRGYSAMMLPTCTGREGSEHDSGLSSA